MKSFKGKNKKVVEVKFDAIHGKVGETSWSIDYNKASKRYSLRSNNFFYSHVSLNACRNKAADKDVVWS